MVVFIVTCSDTDDCTTSVERVFDTEEKAKSYVEDQRLNYAFSCQHYYIAEIEVE